MARVIRNDPLTTRVVRVQTAFDEFLRSRNSLCAKSTCEIYKEVGQRHIVPALIELTGDNMNRITRQVIQQIVDDYAESHTTGGVQYILRHIKAFVNWYWDAYDIQAANPMTKIKTKKASSPPKQGITREEVDKLLQSAKRNSQFPERDIAMIMILCDTGIRRSSLVNLKMKDVNVQRAELTVFEKDQMYHTKAFGGATAKAIRKYLSCLEDVRPDDPFWLCMDGTGFGEQGMRSTLRRLCHSAGIPMHHFHDFRRFYGLELYNSTHDIYLVSRALDHKDIGVTKRYIHIDENEDKEIARIYSPMDRKYGQTGIKVRRGS